MAFNIPWNERYTLLLWAAIITFAAVGVGWWLKRKFGLNRT